MPLECKKRVRSGLLPEYGFSGSLTGALDAGTGRILSHWGDAGWGGAVTSDKGAGRFRDELVDAAAEMVRNRWRPDPPPRWVTCVPSYDQPTLVPHFAKRLATALALPFTPVVIKVKRNAPQKEQQNAAHQCRNLDGVFAVQGDLPGGPVLLVDDVVDSGWTLTVVAGLLWRAGGGPVWPLALATSNPGAWVVVSSTPERGCIWHGAVENLKAAWVPLSVKRNDNPDFRKLRARQEVHEAVPVSGDSPPGVAVAGRSMIGSP